MSNKIYKVQVVPSAGTKNNIEKLTGKSDSDFFLFANQKNVEHNEAPSQVDSSHEDGSSDTLINVEPIKLIDSDH